VQIERQQAVDAGAADHVGDQLGGDRRARGARPAILARIAEVRHHRGDARGRGAPAGVDHDQQFHQVIVGRRTGRLHEEHVAAAHVLHQLDVHLAVAEARDRGAAHRQHQMPRDIVRQRRIGVAREQRDRLSESTLNLIPQDLTGWGGRIRTSEWRDQNPLPYHLATPQNSARPLQGPLTLRNYRQRSIEGRPIYTTRHEARPLIRHARRDAFGRRAARTPGRHTSRCHSAARLRPASRARGDLGKRAHHRFAIVAAERPAKSRAL
jgi:hypothetical protein